MFGHVDVMLDTLEGHKCDCLYKSPPVVSDKSTSAVVGFDTPFAEQMRQSLASIQTCADHQKRITDDALELSRLKSHKLSLINSSFDLCELIQSTITLFTASAEAKVPIKK
jgi:signal transduction histidine kinase